MQITRRNALVGASAAAVTGLTVAPLAMKAAHVKAALAGEPLLAMEQEWLAQRDYIHNYPDDSDDALEPLYQREDAIEEKIMGTPANSFAGIAVKLRMAAYYTFPDADGPEGLDWDRKIMLKTLRDAERLSGGMRP